MRFLLAAILLCAGDDPAPTPLRAIWVTRYDYTTENDIKSTFANCADTGFNTVFFQVRGQADACYRSKLEPWSERLGGKDPGFDPLEVACREAERLKLSLHAWINVMPGWKGRIPPSDPDHVTRKHPEWIVADGKGRRQKLGDHYVCLNPCLPEVRAHIVAVARDIMSRYPLAGLHLDYVRFIEGDWSYDAKTLEIFRRKTGGTPKRKPEEWTKFRHDAVTETVCGIRQAVREARPGALLTAATFPSEKARRGVHQDAEAWLRDGLVDAVFPMAYTDDDDDFRRMVEEAAESFPARDGRTTVYPGIGAYKHAAPEQTVRQMRMCPAGFSIFAYSSLFPSADDQQEESTEARRARLKAVKEYLLKP